MCQVERAKMKAEGTAVYKGLQPLKGKFSLFITSVVSDFYELGAWNLSMNKQIKKIFF